jgi:hypothetical protein
MRIATVEIAEIAPYRVNWTMFIKLAKVRDRLLDHPPPDPNAAHQAPIAMNLPVLLANRMAQVHAAI